eukprot:5550744-Heterocapsa_arctica.AAC.1
MQLPEAGQGGDQSDLGSSGQGLELRKFDVNAQSFHTMQHLSGDSIPRTGNHFLLAVSIGFADSSIR